MGDWLNIRTLCITAVQDLIENIWVFFGIAVVISLSGVMTPGPVFAAAVAKGYKDKSAGIKIAIGHGLVEFPLMAVIVLSLGYIFENSVVKLAIGLVGGALLLFLGWMMIRSRKEIAAEGKEYIPYDSITAGALTTSANPYFFLWWATVGAFLVINAQEFGAVVVVLFAIVHWSCDLAWYTFTSFAVFKTKHLWTPLVHELVFGGCGVLMMVFGVYFIIGPMTELAESL
jgi:threonine/homoserine/homoserine lactone efflux protein